MYFLNWRKKQPFSVNVTEVLFVSIKIVLPFSYDNRKADLGFGTSPLEATLHFPNSLAVCDFVTNFGYVCSTSRIYPPPSLPLFCCLDMCVCDGWIFSVSCEDNEVFQGQWRGKLKAACAPDLTMESPCHPCTTSIQTFMQKRIHYI